MLVHSRPRRRRNTCLNVTASGRNVVFTLTVTLAITLVLRPGLSVAA